MIDFPIIQEIESIKWQINTSESGSYCLKSPYLDDGNTKHGQKTISGEYNVCKDFLPTMPTTTLDLLECSLFLLNILVMINHQVDE